MSEDQYLQQLAYVNKMKLLSDERRSLAEMADNPNLIYAKIVEIDRKILATKAEAEKASTGGSV